MHHDLGLVDSLTPQSLGEPGQRTFKITAASGHGQAIVWMEKEQLFQIGISIKQFIATRSGAASPSPFVPDQTPGFGPVYVEFKAGEMSLKYDSSSDVFTLAATKVEAEEDDGEEEESVQFSFARAEADEMADAALEIVAAGRRPCMLCGRPIDPGGHFCVKVNGHREIDGDG